MYLEWNGAEIRAKLKLHAAVTLSEMMNVAQMIEEKNHALSNGGLMTTARSGTPYRWCPTGMT